MLEMEAQASVALEFPDSIGYCDISVTELWTAVSVADLTAITTQGCCGSGGGDCD
jgi:hypothetical protein